MTKRNKTLTGIVIALTLYDPKAPTAAIRKALALLDAESIGVLHGITGVLIHAMSAKMPDKWIAHIHGDLLEAFYCLSQIARK